MSKTATESDVLKALDAMRAALDISKGHNSRGTATTAVETPVGESGATQIYHTPSNSNPASWAGSTPKDVPSNGNTDSISENGTDYAAQAAMMKSIAVKLSKGLPLNAVEKAVVKAIEEEEKTAKSFPPKKDDDKDGDKDDKKDKNPFADKKEMNKSLADFAAENEEVSKGLDVSDFLANFANVMHKSLQAMESRLESRILGAFVEDAGTTADFNKSLAEVIVGLGDAVMAQGARLEQIEASPARGAKSVTASAQVINKGGFDGGGETLTKSQVADALFELVQKGQASSLDVINFESSGALSSHLETKVRDQIRGR